MNTPNAQVADALSRFDVDDASFIADPYPALGALREATPIVFDERHGVWWITRFADVHATLRDRRLGRQFRQRYTEEEFGQSPLDPRWAAFNAHEEWSLLFLEPPDHTRLRRLISKVFTPRAVASLGPLIDQVSNRLLDDLVERPTFDAIADYAQPFSVEVICSMLGLPPADGPDLLAWSHAIVKMYETNSSDEQKQVANQAAADFTAYIRAAIDDKRANPDDLLISQLAQVTDEGVALTDAEVISTAMVLVEAGHEATVNGLANGLRALLEHGDQYRALTSGDVEPAKAVEEILRYDSPVQMFERWVLDDGVDIAGQQLLVGATVGMLFGSAQRDPRQFADADRFDIARAGDTTHIGFGGGIHFCVGAALARAELSVSLRNITQRLPELSLAAEPRHHPTFVIRGIESLDVAP